MALPKSHRLSLRLNRERLTQTGKQIYGKYFTLVAANTPDDLSVNIPRFAILLSKKTAPLAVDRNKIKRETSSLIFEILSTVSPGDYLVIPKRHVLVENHQNLLKDLKSLFQK